MISSDRSSLLHLFIFIINVKLVWTGTYSAQLHTVESTVSQHPFRITTVYATISTISLCIPLQNYITANESSSHSVVKLTQLVRAHPCSQTSLPLLSSSSSSAFIIEMETWTESLISSTAMLPELSMSKMRNAQLTSSLNLVDYVDVDEFPTLKVLTFFTQFFFI